ncbi:MAG: radical SAM protein [Acidobacteria bacterium]|nr:radical SAM protein [Acidobacteriota bacterium]
MATLREGRISGASISVLAARHCNQSCRGCVAFSPVMPPSFADIDAVRRDLSRLAAVYHARAARVQGGEPLLHPELPRLLREVRRAAIADRIVVLTNGRLLSEMPAAFWSAVDEVRVSAYPSSEPRREQLADWRRKALAHGADLIVVSFDAFRENYSANGSADPALVRRIYAACEEAHALRCHVAWDGYFYKCTRAVSGSAADGVPEPGAERVNGVTIGEGPELGPRLAAYLAARDPLPACRRCLGTVGRMAPHGMVPRSAWRESLAGRTEDLVDWDYLARVERGRSDIYLRPVGEIDVAAFRGPVPRPLRAAVRVLSRRRWRLLLAAPLTAAIRRHRGTGAGPRG